MPKTAERESILKLWRNHIQWAQKLKEPKKKLGILSWSVKNRTECPYLLKEETFWNIEKIANSENKKLRNQKKRWASYPAQLRTGQNAQNDWKRKHFETFKEMSVIEHKKLMNFHSETRKHIFLIQVDLKLTNGIKLGMVWRQTYTANTIWLQNAVSPIFHASVIGVFHSYCLVVFQNKLSCALAFTR